MARTRSTKLPERPEPNDIIKAWDDARWSEVCEKMQLSLARGSLDFAVDLLKKFAFRSIPQMASLDSLVTEVFDTRMAYLLQSEGYQNLRALHYATDAQLKGIPTLGDDCLLLIRETLTAVVAGNRLAVTPSECGA